MKIFLICLAFSCLYFTCAFTDEDSEWIDPGDMLNHKKKYARNNEVATTELTCDIVNKKLTVCENKLEKNCSEKLIEKRDVCDGAYMKMLTRSLVERCSSWLPGSFDLFNNYYITFSLTSSQLLTLSDFIQAKEGNIHDVSNVLAKMIEKSEIKIDAPEGWGWQLIDIFGVSLQTIVQIVGIFLLCVLFILIQMKLKVSWTQMFFQSLIILFFISIPWNWLHMYKKAVAKKYSEVLKEIPEKCHPGDLSLLQTFQNWIQSSFTLSVSKNDECTKYHEALLVDPFWEVAPTQAIAVTLTKFILQPFEHIGEAFNKFLRGTLDGLPFHISLMVLLILVLLIMLILIMLCSYSIRLPFLGGLEPCAVSINNSEKIQSEVRKFYNLMNANSKKTHSPRLTAGSTKVFGKYRGKRPRYLKTANTTSEKEVETLTSS